MPKKEKGITLIALVVTVIVLIILAVISISVLGGKNGTIKNSEKARDETEIRKEREIVEISAVQAAKKNEYGIVERENLKKALNENIGEGKYTLTEDENKFIIVFKESKTKTEHYIEKEPNIETGETIPENPGNTDTIPPIVNISKVSSTSNSITIKVTVTDNETGMISNPTYTYFIKQTSQDDNSYIQKESNSNESYTFLGLLQGTSYDVKVIVEADNAGNIGTGILENQTTEKISKAITFGNATWSNNKASIDISTNTNYTIQYQVNSINGNWNAISNGEKVTNLLHNDTVYARLTDGINYGDYASVSILDKIAPVVTVSREIITSNSIGVSVSALDNESGMTSNLTYTYYIKQSSQSDSSYVQKVSNSSNSYTFTGLTQNMQYDIKVTVEADNGGNIGTGTLLKQQTGTVTSGLVTGAITFGNTTWSSNKASITISTNTNYIIQYQVNSISGTWTNISNGGMVTGLNHGDNIYARLTDETNYGDYASASIIDNIDPTVTVSISMTTLDSIKVQVSASDAQSGLATSGTYKYYLGNTLKSTSTTNSYNFSELTDTTQYTIKVEVVDNAGNMTIKTIDASTRALWTLKFSHDEASGIIRRPASSSNPTELNISDSETQNVNSTLIYNKPIAVGDVIEISYLFHRSNNSYYLDLVVDGTPTYHTYGPSSGLDPSYDGEVLYFKKEVTKASNTCTFSLHRSDAPKAGYYIDLYIYEIKINGEKVL